MRVTREKQIPPAKDACGMTIFVWWRDFRAGAAAAKASQRQRRVPEGGRYKGKDNGSIKGWRYEDRRYRFNVNG
jgi:hypothetical protein